MTKSTSELFEFNKILFIYAVTVLVSFFWLFKMVINKKIILKKTPLDIPISIFFLSQLVSTIFSMDRHTSFFGYYGRFNGGLLSLICYIILYYAFVSNKVNVEKVLKSIVASSITVILWAIPGHFGHDLTCLLFTGQFSNACWDNEVLAFRPELRAFSTLGQPNWLGAYLAVAFFIGIYYFIKNLNNERASHDSPLQILTNKYFILNTGYLLLNFSMILFSRSRSAIGAVIVGLFLFIAYHFYFVKTNFRKILIILLLVSVIPIIFFKTGEEKIDKYLDLKNLFSTLQHQKTIINPQPSIVGSNNVTESFDIRKIVWQGAWQLALKYPLFGTGVETFAYSYNFVRPAAHNLTSEWDYVYNKAHNEYFNYLATTGFIGLGAYLLLIFSFQFSIFNQFLKFKFLSNEKSMKNGKFKMQIEENKFNKQILAVTLSIAYITILITNFFGFSTTTIQLFFFLIPAFLFADLTDLSKGSPQGATPTAMNNLQKILLLLLLASTIYLLFSLTVYYMADVNYSFGSKYAKVANQQKAATYLEKAIKLRNEPVYADRFSSSLSYLAALASLQNQKDLAKQIAVLSDQYNRKLIELYPKNVFYWKTRAKNMFYFYQVTGNENELLQGVMSLKTARKLYPTDPKISYSLALYYNTLFDTSKDNLKKQDWKALSLVEINKTIELKSNYREAYLFKGQLLKKYGLLDEAKKVFEYMLKNFDKNDAEVLKELR